MGDVGGEQVVHLVSEAGLEHQLGVGAAVPDREVEEAWPRHPVDDVAEGQRRQQVLGVKCLCFQRIGRRGDIIILLLILFSVLLLCSSLLFILTAGACCAAWCCMLSRLCRGDTPRSCSSVLQHYPGLMPPNLIADHKTPAKERFVANNGDGFY